MNKKIFFTMAIGLMIAYIISACGPSAAQQTATSRVIAATQAAIDPTFVYILHASEAARQRQTVAAATETAEAIERLVHPTPDQSTMPCSLGPDVAWRFILTPTNPLKIGDTIFSLDGNTVSVNNNDFGPWTLKPGQSVQLGPFVGLCFGLSDENIVSVQGSKDIPEPLSP